MAVSDGSGGVLYRFVYDTYGELSDIKTDDGISLKNSEIVSEKTKDHTVEELAHAAGLTYLYNGQYGVATDQNGLYYMRARYYDQDIKRFINRDIVSGDITNSKSLNRYAYVQGNPVSLTDPFGLCPDSNAQARLIRTFLCDTDWSTVGHTALGVAGMFWNGANLINAVWYAAEGNTEMAISSALSLIPFATGGTKLLSMGKLAKYGKTVSIIGQTVLGITGTIAGISMIQTGFGNFLDGLLEGRVDGKSLLMMLGGAIITGISMGSLYGTLTTAAKAADTACATAPKGEKPTLLDSQDTSGKPLTDEEIAASNGIRKTRNVGENNQSVVYRVIREDENPANGLMAKNPQRNMSIEGHIISGSRNNGSQFISTTTDINVANKYAQRDGCRIVDIDLNKLPDNTRIYDLSTDVGRNTYLKGITARNFARSSSEVLIEGYIPNYAITLHK